MNNLAKKLAELVKAEDAQKFYDALTSETDTDYQLSDLVVRTSSEEQTLRDNIIAEARDKHFNDAFEIQIKNLKKAEGLEFEGKKPEDFLKALKEKTLKEAKLEPEKKVSELEASLEKLRNDLLDKESKYRDLESSIEKKETMFKVESMIPDLPETLGLSKQEARDLFFMQHEIKEDGIYRNGQKLKDNMEGALDLSKAVQTYVSEKGWDKKPSGRGGGAAGGAAPSVPTNMTEYETYIKEKGFHPGSQEARAVLAKAVEANPDFE